LQNEILVQTKQRFRADTQPLGNFGNIFEKMMHFKALFNSIYFSVQKPVFKQEKMVHPKPHIILFQTY